MYKEIHILVGLPGSGKSSYAKSVCGDKKSNFIIDFDFHIFSKIKNMYTRDDIRNVLKDTVDYYLFIDSIPHLYIDGLFLTMDIVEDLIHETLSLYDKQLPYRIKPGESNVVKFVIDQWNEDRAACLSNDNFRYLDKKRKTPSAITIKNATYEDIDIDSLNNHMGITLNEFQNIRDKKVRVIVEKVDHKVILYNVKDKLLYDYGALSGILKSERWSKGGTWADYTGASGTIGEDEQPEFKELDEILARLCPNLSFLKYKFIMKEYVEIKEEAENDYYGGTEYYAHYEGRINEILNYLKQNNLLENEQS